MATVMPLSLVFFLVGSCAATFQTIDYLPLLDDGPGIWRGNPTVIIGPGLTYGICADDTYWNSGVADAICENYGFEGAMVISGEMPEDNAFVDGYVVCNLVDIQDSELKTLSCEIIDMCDSVPRISCILPGYKGCYAHTADTPYFPSGVTAPAVDQPYDIVSCASACTDTPYFGLTDGQVCMCGSDLGTNDEGVCDVVCQADDSQACGGNAAISTYDANVIGKCNSERVVLPLAEAYYITSPKFPESYTLGESCTWLLGFDNAQSANLDMMVAFNFYLNTANNLRVTREPSGSVLNTIHGGSGTVKVRVHPVTAGDDTLKIVFAPPDSGLFTPGAGFSMKIVITGEPIDPKTDPTITDSAMSTSSAYQNQFTTKLDATTAGITEPATDSITDSNTNMTTPGGEPIDLNTDPTNTDPPMTTSSGDQIRIMTKIVVAAVLGPILTTLLLKMN